MLLYCLGAEAETVLSSTNIKESERENYKKVIDKFNQYFKVRRNVIFERAKLNRRDQLEGKTAETFIAELYSLVQHCDYGQLMAEMVRD